MGSGCFQSEEPSKHNPTYKNYPKLNEEYPDYRSLNGPEDLLSDHNLQRLKYNKRANILKPLETNFSEPLPHKISFWSATSILQLKYIRCL